MSKLIGLHLFIATFLGVALAQTGDIQTIKMRIKADLLQAPPSDKQIEALLTHINPDGSFNDINYADLSATANFPQGRHTANLALLAKAYASSTSKYYKSETLRESLIKLLQFWVDKDFVGENWHNNQITTPTNLVNLMLAAGDDLPNDLIQKAQPIIGRANMTASGYRPGGDRIVIAGVIAKNLLFIGDYKGFEKMLNHIENEMTFSTGERGIQQDFSFHHRVDRVNNTDSYGYDKFANGYGEWSYYVAGTKYQFSQERLKILIDYYLDGAYKNSVTSSGVLFSLTGSAVSTIGALGGKITALGSDLTGYGKLSGSIDEFRLYCPGIFLHILTYFLKKCCFLFDIIRF